MKPEITRHRLTDADRNACLKLLTCELSTDEIVDIMHISRSTVSYIRQAYNACLSRNWSILQKLSCDSRATVDWAMKITGVDKEALEIFGKPENEKVESEPVVETATAAQNKQFIALYDTLLDIRNLLADIRNMLQ